MPPKGWKKNSDETYSKDEPVDILDLLARVPTEEFVSMASRALPTLEARQLITAFKELKDK
jgi:hypothetical protein